MSATHHTPARVRAYVPAALVPVRALAPGNRLLERMEPEDRWAVMSESVPVNFAQGHVFCEPGESIDHVHFVETGVISSVAVLQDGRTVETIMIGREGLSGAMAGVAPSRAHSRNVGQVAGSARRMEAARLRTLMDERPGVRRVVGAFMAHLQGELEQNCACNALHRADQRFAKWLLRCHDRVEGPSLHLTQEYLASMLGSQRTTVNEAAQSLQRAKAIAYSRGRLLILGRAALEQAACECYVREEDRIDAPVDTVGPFTTLSRSEGRA